MIKFKCLVLFGLLFALLSCCKEVAAPDVSGIKGAKMNRNLSIYLAECKEQGKISSMLGDRVSIVTTDLTEACAVYNQITDSHVAVKDKYKYDYVSDLGYIVTLSGELTHYSPALFATIFIDFKEYTTIKRIDFYHIEIEGR